MEEKIECGSADESRVYPVKVRVVGSSQIRVAGEERGRQAVWVRTGA
jgi:hypothetical protein